MGDSDEKMDRRAAVFAGAGIVIGALPFVLAALIALFWLAAGSPHI